MRNSSIVCIMIFINDGVAISIVDGQWIDVNSIESIFNLADKQLIQAYLSVHQRNKRGNCVNIHGARHILNFVPIEHGQRKWVLSIINLIERRNKAHINKAHVVSR